MVVSAVGVAAGLYVGVDFTYIHSNFLQLATASFLISMLLSIYLFVRSRSASPEQLALGGSSGTWSSPHLSKTDTLCCLLYLFLLKSHSPGNVAYDFFKGRELNPRIKNFDLKFFCEMRPGLIGWVSLFNTYCSLC